MASSSAPQDVQRENARLQQDTRPMSFFGKVKSYITAPFSWLMGTNEDTNDYEERDGPGKRKRSPMAPLEPREGEEAQHLGTKRAPIKRVRYQTGHEPVSLRQEPLSASHLASTLTQSFPTSAHTSAFTRTWPFASAGAQPSASTSAQSSASTSAQPSASTRTWPFAFFRTQPPASASAQPSASTSAHEERDGHGKRKRTRTAMTPAEIEEEEEEEEEEIQYLGGKSPELKRRKYEPGPGRLIRENDLESTSEALEKPPHYVPWPGPEALAIHKPTEWYSVCFGPVLPPVGIVRLFVRIFLHVFLMSTDYGSGSR